MKPTDEHSTRLDGPWTYGEEPQQGKRTDLDEIKGLLDEGTSVESIATSHFADWCRYRQSFKEYALLRQPKRNWQTTVTVYWGPSGTGKTRRAAADAGDGAYWLNNTGGNVLWWDGYTGQETVVIDEFYGWIKYSDMLRIIDRYPYAVQVTYPAPLLSVLMRIVIVIASTSQVRGASVNFIARHIIITSNTHPTAWWQQGLRAMERRLNDPIGTVEAMLVGVWEPPPIIMPLQMSMGIEDPPHLVPGSPGPMRTPGRESPPATAGWSIRRAISSLPSGGALSPRGRSASPTVPTALAVISEAAIASASMSGRVSPGMMTWRTPSPNACLDADLWPTLGPSNVIRSYDAWHFNPPPYH